MSNESPKMKHCRLCEKDYEAQVDGADVDECPHCSFNEKTARLRVKARKLEEQIAREMDEEEKKTGKAKGKTDPKKSGYPFV